MINGFPSFWSIGAVGVDSKRPELEMARLRDAFVREVEEGNFHFSAEKVRNLALPSTSHAAAPGVDELRMRRAFDRPLPGIAPCTVKWNAAKEKTASEHAAAVGT